jgi:spermidine synthase
MQVVFWLFFLSGFAALVYEISWSRQIGLLFGHTAGAAAVVLAAYFAGLAAGGALAARSSRTTLQPLRAYGAAEMLVAVWALLTPVLLELMRRPFVAELLNHDNASIQTTVRILAAVVVLLPATVALGATLPFIASHFSPANDPQPRSVALAYAVNTAGALVGVAATTYILILWAGVQGSSNVAAVLSAGCGATALWLSRRPDSRIEGTKQPVCRSATPSSVGSSLYALAALAGFGSLGLQVLYTRLFSLLQHNSTYTFGNIVITFLAALTVAGWAASRTRGKPSAIAAWAMLAGGLAIPCGVLLLGVLTRFQYLNSDGCFAGYILTALGLVVVTLFPPVFFLGLVLPTLWAQAQGQAAAFVGRLTAVNTLAAAVGALLTAFLILPRIGLWASLVGFSSLYVIAGAWVLVRAVSYKGGIVGTLAGLLAILACVAVLRIPHYLDSQQSARGLEFIYRRDTPYGQIDVLSNDRNGVLRMRQNRFYTLGTSGNVQFELQQGILPLLLHPAPSEVACLGVGTGVTAGAVLQNPSLSRLTAVELIPEVLEAAEYFEEYNCYVLQDSRAKTVINDARHFLYASSDKFDVIISDLFVPWHSQTGYLYTVDHYRSAAARLKPNGLFFQWLPAYQLSAEHLEMIADSFASVFPVTTVWVDESLKGYPLVGLAGSNDPIRLSIATEPTGLVPDSVTAPSAVSAEVQKFIQLLLSQKVWRLYRGDWLVGKDAVFNTDEFPRIEFQAPVAYAEGQELRGSRWREYNLNVLGKLPKQNLEVRTEQ